MRLATKGDSSAPKYGLLQGKSGLYAVALLCLSLVVRLIPAYLVYGSFDVDAWRQVIEEFRQRHNPYETGKLNWPPLWPLLLIYTGRAQEVYGVPEYFSVKLIPIFADACIALALYFWFAQRTNEPKTAFKRALWYALNPIAIATCALQGQFEALPSLFALLAIMQATREQESGAISFKSAAWLCMGGMAKTWPLILLPAFMNGFKSWRERTIFACIAVLPVVISVAILYYFDPPAIASHVLAYRGRSGMWGLTSLNVFLSAEAGGVWTRAAFWFLAGGWAIVYAKTWRKGSVAQVACLGVLTFYVFTNGMGPQYCAWILGLALFADFPRARLYTVIATLCVGTMYVFNPYNGEYFNYVLHSHTPLFWANNLNLHHRRMAALNFLPLWIFCIWWWRALLRDVLKTPHTTSSERL